MPNNEAEEKRLLDDSAAISKAKPFGRFDDNGKFDAQKVPDGDPYAEEIAPSLLNAGDIKKYVLATGLISPFYEGGGKNSRMKDASYEGRIGENAYIFESDKKEPTRIFNKGDPVLRLPPNSIVFVESDLYFRIPEFIALRFNLQIKHVHRGLLLGTGPLIDPGYWGKLCIPIHNLTDEEYCIPAEEGLIWIEFTKTTSIAESIGRPPLGREFKDIKDFLYKASNQYTVGIRSSIDGAIQDSAERAENAEKSAKTAQKWVSGIGIAGGIAAAIGIIGIFLAGVSVVWNYNNDVRDLDTKLQQYIELLDGNAAAVAQATISSLSQDIRDLSTEVTNLTSELEGEQANRQWLEETIEALVQNDRSNTARFEKLLERCSSLPDGEKPEFCKIIAD